MAVIDPSNTVSITKPAVRQVVWNVSTTFYQSEPYIRNAVKGQRFQTWESESRILYGSPGDGELDLRGVRDEN